MGWKIFSLSKINNIILLENNFTVREGEGYKKGDKHMSLIYKEI